MNRDPFLRIVLRVAAAFNLVGALLFTFPASTPGQLAGLPPEVPALYRGLTALFVLLFGGAYAWLAAQPVIDRSFVAFGAIGKTSAFLLVAALWLAGAAPAAGVAAIGGDLVLAALMFYGLGGSRSATRP